MNRRSFIDILAKAAAGFTILPPATTYSRVWRAQRPLKLAAFWYQEECFARCCDQGYVDAMKNQRAAVERAFWRTIFYGEPIPRDLIT